MINISTLFDPRYVFLIYAPILFAFNKRVGHRMIIALTLAEWANQILKWLLAGERPYWYVHERANELAQQQQQELASGNNFTEELTLEQAADGSGAGMTHLKQFPVTCELGAGSPSGHAMVTATVWYILIDAYLKNELQPFGRADYSCIALRSSGANTDYASTAHPQKASSSQLLSKLFWSMYTVMLLLVSLSRVYLACHFPHQCIFGALLGCMLARGIAELLPMERLQKRHFCYATATMFATVMATYGVLRLTGFDPLWSVGKALRWCVKTEYIHLDTTPFFSMMRYLGFCLGSGLAYDSAKISLSSAQKTGAGSSGARIMLTIRRLIVVGVAVAFGQFLMGLPMPKSNLNLFYVISFVMYTLFSYAIAGPIPDLVKSVLPSSTVAATRTHLKQR